MHHIQLHSIVVVVLNCIILVFYTEGEAMLISMVSRSVLHYYHFQRRVHAISFSPDGS